VASSSSSSSLRESTRSVVPEAIVSSSLTDVVVADRTDGRHRRGVAAVHGHNPAMARSKVRLPRDLRDPYEVYLNGVPQRLGVDYSVREGSLVFERDLRKDKISGWRWLLGAWGVGTYRQNDSVDVRYAAADGSPRVAEGLEIEPG
jgi:hypothetical protein